MHGAAVALQDPRWGPWQPDLFSGKEAAPRHNLSGKPVGWEPTEESLICRSRNATQPRRFNVTDAVQGSGEATRSCRNPQARDPQDTRHQHTSFFARGPWAGVGLCRDPGGWGQHQVCLRASVSSGHRFRPHFIGQSHSGPRLAGERGRKGRNPPICLEGRDGLLVGDSTEGFHTPFYRSEPEAQPHGLESPKVSGRVG